MLEEIGGKIETEVLDNGKLVALMAQTCAREGKRVGDERDTEAIDEIYHFRDS